MIAAEAAAGGVRVFPAEHGAGGPGVSGVLPQRHKDAVPGGGHHCQHRAHQREHSPHRHDLRQQPHGPQDHQPLACPLALLPRQERSTPTTTQITDAALQSNYDLVVHLTDKQYNQQDEENIEQAWTGFKEYYRFKHDGNSSNGERVK